MSDAIKQVEANRGRFAALTDSELAARRDFIKTTRAILSTARAELAHGGASSSGIGLLGRSMCGGRSDGLSAGSGDAERDSLMPRDPAPAKGTGRKQDARSSTALDAHGAQLQLQSVEQERRRVTRKKRD